MNQEMKDHVDGTNSKTLSADSHLNPGRAAKKAEYIEGQEQMGLRGNKMIYDTLELKGPKYVGQRDCNNDRTRYNEEMNLRNPSMSIEPSIIKQIQLTQRNNNDPLITDEQSVFSVIGGQNDLARVSTKPVGRSIEDSLVDQATSIGQIQNTARSTNRSFKMDDILQEGQNSARKSEANGQGGPGIVKQDKNNRRSPNQAQKEEKFMPLNMKEIQMDIQNEEYMNALRAGKFKEHDASGVTLKKRSSNTVTSAQTKKKGHQQ